MHSARRDARAMKALHGSLLLALARQTAADPAELRLGECSIKYDTDSPNALNSSCSINTPETKSLRAEVAQLRAGRGPSTPPTLSSTDFSVCGVATNPTSWIVSDAGMLGTHTNYHDTNNWSVDCTLSVKEAVLAGATEIMMRVYDPVAASAMDFTYTFDAQSWLIAFQNPDPTAASKVLSGIKPSSPGAFFSRRKSWSVGTKTAMNAQVHTKPSTTQAYCNGGGDSGEIYAGTNVTSALTFLTGGGDHIHASLCSTGLGMYGASQCTTGSSYSCYIGGSTSCGTNCLSDAGQRAAVSMKLPTASPALTSSAYTVCGVATNPTSWVVSGVGILGTYDAWKDKDNWSIDCRKSLATAISAGATKVKFRLYDPVDAGAMDFEYTYDAQGLYDALQNYNPSVEDVRPTLHGSLPSAGDFMSHKSWAVGTSVSMSQPRFLTKPSYIQSYCNGGSGVAKFAGLNLNTAFNFMVGGGGHIHASLCSTGLGMYGASQCTTGSSYSCYIGGSTSCGTNCLSDAGQRAAVSMKLV